MKRTIIEIFDEHSGELLDGYTFDGITDPTGTVKQPGEIWRVTVEIHAPFTVLETLQIAAEYVGLAVKTVLEALGRPAARRIDRYLVVVRERERLLKAQAEQSRE